MGSPLSLPFKLCLSHSILAGIDCTIMDVCGQIWSTLNALNTAESQPQVLLDQGFEIGHSCEHSFPSGLDLNSELCIVQGVYYRRWISPTSCLYPTTKELICQVFSIDKAKRIW
jgi:hypothetical protein